MPTSHLAQSSELLWPSALQHLEVDDVPCSLWGGFSPEELGHSETRLRIEGEAKGQAGNLTPAQDRAHPCPLQGQLNGFSVRSECSPALLQKRIKEGDTNNFTICQTENPCLVLIGVKILKEEIRFGAACKQ